MPLKIATRKIHRIRYQYIKGNPANVGLYEANSGGHRVPMNGRRNSQYHPVLE
jgi:hypothetical protein